jgi:DNA-directed RNA polymerase beta' subunit
MKNKHYRLGVVAMDDGIDMTRIITDPVPVSKDFKKFTDGGLFSPRIFGASDSDVIMYSCECGELFGRFHSGEICSTCKTEANERGASIERMGWIDLGEDNTMIHPLMFQHVKKILGKAAKDILGYDPKLDLRGDHHRGTSDGPYDNLGMIGFREKYEEVLSFYAETGNDSVQESLAFVSSYPELMFSQYIPVFSKLLRPAFVSGETITFSEENVTYGAILTAAESLKSLKDGMDCRVHRLKLLWEIQENMDKVFARIVEILSGKNGLLRGYLLGSRFNFSSRTVISPLPATAGYQMNEVEYPYFAAVEMLRFEIINLLRRNGSIASASRTWKAATASFCPRVYDVVCELVETTVGGVTLLINRNPTLQLGNILYMRIAKVKDNPNDLTMGLPNNILGFLSGDYDGDVLNTFSIKDLDHKKFFERLDPRRLVISADHAGINSSVYFASDYAAGTKALVSM